jgi:hypothetical protein
MEKEVSQQPEEEVLELGKIGYTAYLANTGGISLATGCKLPPWGELNQQVRDAWIAAGSAIGMALVDALKGSAAKSGGKARVKLSGEFAALVEAEDAEPEQHRSPVPEQLVPPVQKPSIGRIVHYTNLGDKDGKYPPEQQAALVTGLNQDGTVALKVFYKTGTFDMPSVEYADRYERGKWSWPERVA